MRKIILIGFVLILFVTSLPIKASAITLGDYENKLKEYTNELLQKQTEMNKTVEALQQTQNEIESIKKEMTDLSNEITELHKEIAEYNEEIKEKSLQTKEMFQYFQMSQGENVYMEYIFGAESITDLIYRVSIVEQMTDYNNKITKELEEMIKENEEREIEIGKKTKELTAKKEILDAKMITLGYSKQNLQEGLVKVESEIKTYNQRVETYKSLGCKSHHVIGIDCAKSGSAGTFRRPVSLGYISSEFGSRWGSFHRGLDISNWDPYNTKIYPIGNGTVVYKDVDYYGALMLAIEYYDAVTGKYYTSLYGHMDSYAPNIYVGRFLTSDDYIGIMGNTGYSTGPHLHMEIAQCRLHVDYQCRTLDAFFNYIRQQANYGFKGPRQLINFPDTYTYWYSR